jgi:hypothetical protein
MSVRSESKQSTQLKRERGVAFFFLFFYNIIYENNSSHYVNDC